MADRRETSRAGLPCLHRRPGPATHVRGGLILAVHNIATTQRYGSETRDTATAQCVRSGRPAGRDVRSIYQDTVSPVLQLAVPLQNVRCSSCSLSDLLASHSSELLSAFFVFLVLIFLFFVFFWSGLFCYVLVPVTLAFHLPYLD